MILSIETSTPNASLAVLDVAGREVVFETRFTSNRAHNALIFAPLREALAAAGELTRVIAGTGPGSYSGVRVGIAVANGLAVARGIDATGFPSMCALLESGLVVGDARRNAFFAAEITNRQMNGPARILSPEAFQNRVEQALKDGIPVVTMDAKPPLGLTGIRCEVPQAREIGRFGAQLPVLREAIEPVYVREPYITQEKPKAGLT